MVQNIDQLTKIKNMYSQFRTPNKTFNVKVDKYTCNKFGISECLIKHIPNMLEIKPLNVLDVGCGVGVLGIYFASLYRSNVVGVELNPIACNCAVENINALNLNSNFKVININFNDFILHSDKHKFDLIISTPPVDDSISKNSISSFSDYNYHYMNDQAFKYLTNSWHLDTNTDLVDLIFKFSRFSLNKKGAIILGFCSLTCNDLSYISNKALKEGLLLSSLKQDEISASRVGAESLGINNITVYTAKFIHNSALSQDTGV